MMYLEDATFVNMCTDCKCGSACGCGNSAERTSSSTTIADQPHVLAQTVLASPKNASVKWVSVAEMSHSASLNAPSISVF
ncbi:hypothetical protein FA15DRAFT_407610 [Coprinopsis marcescibilis]|uniref:Uncharacterized protein n=1 Tax=Coprinopsis marcescibilis TaxID=230819 RepID=A0A5C3K9J3_COPMA|nr:hypothetical protein FA15DRAFT_407610 [Coprinopsis marcescibilis]